MSDPDLRQFRLARQQLELKRGKIRLQMDQRRWDKLQEEDEAEAAEADGGKGEQKNQVILCLLRFQWDRQM